MTVYVYRSLRINSKNDSGPLQKEELKSADKSYIYEDKYSDVEQITPRSEARVEDFKGNS